MPIRTILAPFTSSTDMPAIQMALTVAADLGAHVDAVFVEQPEAYVPAAPRPPAMAGIGAGPYTAPGVPAGNAARDTVPDPYAAAARSRDHAAGAAQTAFENLCGLHKVRFLDRSSNGARDDHSVPSASCRRESSPVAQVIGTQGQSYDVIVTESASVSSDGKSARGAIEAALMQCGRPVLLAPMHPPQNLDGSVLVAWNDSPQCWHALTTALPFMTKAEEVVLLHAGTDRAEQLSEEKAADYLAWHGIEAKVVQDEPGPNSIADYLMSQCSERGVSLMVMGAYSHSPWRERLLGGVTLSVLTNAAATPVLMMH